MFCCKDFDQVVPVYLQMVVCLPSILTFYWQLHFPACLQVLDECLCDRTLSRELFMERYATQSKVIKSLLKIIWDIFSSLNLWNVANKEFTFWMSIVYSCYLNINKNLWASFSQVSLRIVERSLIGKNSRTCGVFTCVVLGFFLKNILLFHNNTMPFSPLPSSVLLGSYKMKHCIHMRKTQIYAESHCFKNQNYQQLSPNRENSSFLLLTKKKKKKSNVASAKKDGF